MTDDELKDYATTLIESHAQDVEFLSIFEMAEEYLEAGEISEDDARKVSDLIRDATVVVFHEDREELFQRVRTVLGENGFVEDAMARQILDRLLGEPLDD